MALRHTARLEPRTHGSARHKRQLGLLRSDAPIESGSSRRRLYLVVAVDEIVL